MQRSIARAFGPLMLRGRFRFYKSFSSPKFCWRPAQRIGSRVKIGKLCEAHRDERRRGGMETGRGGSAAGETTVKHKGECTKGLAKARRTHTRSSAENVWVSGWVAGWVRVPACCAFVRSKRIGPKSEPTESIAGGGAEAAAVALNTPIDICV